jgi:hypothetical protein
MPLGPQSNLQAHRLANTRVPCQKHPVDSDAHWHGACRHCQASCSLSARRLGARLSALHHFCDVKTSVVSPHRTKHALRAPSAGGVVGPLANHWHTHGGALSLRLQVGASLAELEPPASLSTLPLADCGSGTTVSTHWQGCLPCVASGSRESPPQTKHAPMCPCPVEIQRHS